MDETALLCPKCGRPLEPDVRICPVDHGITGGVYGVTVGSIKRTPLAKRHMLGLVVNESYVINGYLGSGGFGAVYRAEQKALGRDVALKLLMVDAVNDPVVIHRFKREARTAAALLDPNIVTLFDYGETTLGETDEDHLLYFVMELVQGPTLRQLVKAEGGLGLEGALKTGVNILRGLAAAHQLGVVHRDLKPGNVLIDESKNRAHFARLFDFGISSLQGSGGHTTQMGQGGVLGTPKYMAPEQWRAQQTAPCTDVYAFGAMLCEMLTGEPPIPKADMAEMAAAHCKGPRPDVTRTSRDEPVPLALTHFIKKCMAVDPRQRYGSAREALDALVAIDESRDAAPVPAVSRFEQPGAGDADPSGSISGAVSVSVSEPGTGSVSGAISGAIEPPPLPPGAADDSDVIKVQIEEPRKLWPWVLGAIGVALLIVGVQIVRSLQQQPPAPAAAATGAASPTPAAAAAPAPRDAAVAPPDAAAPAPDAATVDAAPIDAAPIDAARPPDAAPEPPKPSPPRVALARTARDAPAKAPPKTPPPVPAAPPAPIKVAGGETVTPLANPTADDLAQAEDAYRRGVDAQGRGAPKSAQRFFVRALRLGLKGRKASDAQRRIKQIVDETTLEASEF